MDFTHQHIAFLCGYFKIKDAPSNQALIGLGWEKFNLPDDIRKIEKRFFYPEFVDFCYADSTDKTCVRYVKRINEEQDMTLKEKNIHFSIKEITLYLMPFKMAMFSIHIEQETTDLDDCTSLLFSLRSIDNYSEIHQTFIEKAIQPFLDVYEVLVGTKPAGYSELIDNGNKLRVFQVVNSHDTDMAALSEADKDKYLYQLATLSKVTKPGEIDEYSPSESYLKKIIDQSKISVFRNWNGLALMDTFTIHAFDASNGLINNWTDTYFRMIYIHSIFQKSYLFNLNIRFRNTLAQPVPSWKARLQSFNMKHTDVGQLVDEYESFEQKCCFHKISYNFLPLEIAEAIDKGLDIKEEMQQLYKVMEKEKTRREEANDKMVNTLLFCLSLMTLFSAIWDISCLLDQMYPYAEYMGGQTFGYRTVALLLLLAVCFFFLTIYNRKKTEN